MRRALVVGTVLALASLPVQASMSEASPEPAPGTVQAAGPDAVRITFNDAVARVPVLTSSGSAAVGITLVSQAAGALRSVSSRLGEGRAARMPKFIADGAGPRAVVAVWPTVGDPLSPGTATFTFGADVRLDTGTTSGLDASAGDNGDNVLQRGRFADASQYKLQLDHGRPSCRVKGASGTLMVKGAEVVRGDWYTLSCDRAGSTLSLTATHYDAYGDVLSTDTTSATGPTGQVRAASAAVPLSIGGKLADDSTLARATDQFNGRIDNVVLTIG